MRKQLTFWLLLRVHQLPLQWSWSLGAVVVQRLLAETQACQTVSAVLLGGLPQDHTPQDLVLVASSPLHLGWYGIQVSHAQVDLAWQGEVVWKMADASCLSTSHGVHRERPAAHHASCGIHALASHHQFSRCSYSQLGSFLGFEQETSRGF